MKEGFAVWLTGIPASGKTTIAKALYRALREKGYVVEVLESDELRKIIAPRSSYSEEGRDEFYRALVYVGQLLARNGIGVIFDATANKRKYRRWAREGIKRFVEVYVKCSLEEAMRRDPKGLYKRAKRGEVKDLPGLQAVYEEPLSPEVIVNTEEDDVKTAVRRIVEKLEEVLKDESGRVP